MRALMRDKRIAARRRRFFRLFGAGAAFVGYFLVIFPGYLFPGYYFLVIYFQVIVSGGSRADFFALRTRGGLICRFISWLFFPGYLFPGYYFLVIFSRLFISRLFISRLLFLGRGRADFFALRTRGGLICRLNFLRTRGAWCEFDYSWS